MTSIPPRKKNIEAPDVEIYRDYLTAKRADRGIGDILLKYGISRSSLYNIVRRVRHGDPERVERDMEKARFTALWEHKYKNRFLALPKNRSAETVTELRSLIRDMAKDKFPQSLIAELTGKDRSTIIHHLS